jgi:hypothetical protein
MLSSLKSFSMGFSSCFNCCLVLAASAVQQGQDVDQLRGKVATEATKEARNHAASAAQAISAAREATMELDKVVHIFS